MSFEKRLGVGGQIALKQIGIVELAKQLYHLALSGCGISKAFCTDAPQLTDSASTIEHRDKMVGRIAQTKVVIIGRMLQNVPFDATVMLSVNVDSTEQLRR